MLTLKDSVTEYYVSEGLYIGSTTIPASNQVTGAVQQYSSTEVHQYTSRVQSSVRGRP